MPTHYRAGIRTLDVHTPKANGTANGVRLAQELRAELVRTGLTLEDVLQRETEWYEANQRTLAADRVVFGDYWGAPISQ